MHCLVVSAAELSTAAVVVTECSEHHVESCGRGTRHLARQRTPRVVDRQSVNHRKHPVRCQLAFCSCCQHDVSPRTCQSSSQHYAVKPLVSDDNIMSWCRQCRNVDVRYVKPCPVGFTSTMFFSEPADGYLWQSCQKRRRGK